MEDGDALQRQTADRLLPAMEDLADAACRGDVAGLVAHERRLARLVVTCPDRALAMDFLALVPMLVGERWDEDRAAGEPLPRPPLLTLSQSLISVQEFLAKIGATRGVAETLLARAQEAGEREDETGRRTCLSQARDVLGALGDVDALRMRAVADGLLQKSLGRYRSAAEAFSEAARRSSELGLPGSQASSLAELAGVLRAQGSHADAASVYERAAALAGQAALAGRAVVWTLCAADARVAAGRDAVTMHRFTEAVELFARARAAYRAAGPDQAGPAAHAALHRGIAEFSLAQGATAREWFRTAEAEYEALGDVAGLGDVHFAWGNEALARGDVPVGERMLRAAHAELTVSGRSDAAAECSRLMASVAARRARPFGVPLQLGAVARASTSPRSGPAGADAEDHLVECHRRMLAAGSPLPAARVAVALARLAADTGREAVALGRAVPALLGLRDLDDTLDAGARAAWWATTADAAGLALRAAARRGDRQLVAELLETVRGAGLPEPGPRTDGAPDAWAELLADVAAEAPPPSHPGPYPRDRRGGASVERPPTALTVIMPWCRRALEPYLSAAQAYGERREPRTVVLEVPR